MGQHADRGVVVYLPCAGYHGRHERGTHLEIAKRLAGCLGFDAAGDYDPNARYPGRVYLVPSDTLVAPADGLGVRTQDDVFGGVVPARPIATKVIAHPLAAPAERAPAGWSMEFGRRVAGVVLDGVSAFTPEDARSAGLRLLAGGPVRVKPARETGGRGQVVAGDAASFDHALDALDPAALSRDGVVIERHLDEVTTFSVGQMRVGDLLASYWGIQSLTPDNAGRAVYGGSALTVVRGGFDSLLAHEPPANIRLAIAQAQIFDAAATACFPGLLASRRNYDVLQGVDAQGRRRSGVLEQSWRIGGASTAEVVALEAFRSDPGLGIVRASCCEVYGVSTPPPGAAVFFHGDDADTGLITKFALVEPHVHE